jgi:Fe2+ transport system protein FeoA
MTVFEAPLRTWLQVRAIQGNPIFQKRLHEMGITPGDKIIIQQRMPWSGPLVVSLGDITVALRAEEAACLLLV